MAILLIVLAVVLGILALGAVCSAFACAAEDMPIGAGILAFLAVVLVALTVVSYIAGGRRLSHTSCDNFADQTGYTTKVIVTNMFDTGECYVRVGDGDEIRWVPKGQVWAEMRHDEAA
jgi:membrane protein implicated in regulation of membrane protease activity